MKPSDVDVKWVHELINTLKEDGNCTLTDYDRQQVIVNIRSEMVVKALRLEEGNYDTSAMKLS